MTELALIGSAPKQFNWADKIAWLAAKISVLEGAQVEADDFNIRHSFRGVWYIREFDLPADHFFIGRTHLQGHIVKLIRGSSFLYVPEGPVLRYCAPAIIHTKPGFQTVAHTITEVTAQSWHLNPDGCRDIAELEAEYFAPPSLILERGAQLIQEALTWSAP